MENKEFTSAPVDMASLPPEIRAKMLNRKTINHPGSFVKPDIPETQKTEYGVGGKAPENKKQTKSAEIAKTKDEEKQTTSTKEKTEFESINDLATLGEKCLSAVKYQKLLDLINEKDDVAGQLGISFDDDDLSVLLFKGEVEKDVDIFKNGKLIVKFKSLTQGEREQVEKLKSQAIRKDDDEVLTRFGQDKFLAKRYLASSIVSVNGEKVGTTIEEKLKYLSSQSDWTYNYILTAYNLFVLAVGEIFRADTLKKS